MSSKRATLLGVIAIFVGMLLIKPADYLFYAKASRSLWQNPANLYSETTFGFFYLPWSFWLITPLSFLPDRIAQALLNTLSLTFLIWAMRTMRVQNKATIALAIATPFSVVHFLLGQWDGLIVSAAILGLYALIEQRPWLLGLAIVIITTKPVNILIVGVVWVLYVKRFGIKRILIASILPLLAFASSFLIAGTDWIQRFIDYNRSNPVIGFNIAFWESHLPLAIIIGVVGVIELIVLLFLLRSDQPYSKIAVALVASLLVSFYVTPYHLIALSPSLGLILKDQRRLGLILWLLCWLIFAFFAIGMKFLAEWFTFLEIAILFATMFIANRQQSQATKPIPAPLNK